MDWIARFRQKRIANVNVGRCSVFEENREISMKRPKRKKAHRDKLGSSINMNRDSLHRQSVQQCGGEPSRKKEARTSGSLMSMVFAIDETLAQKARIGELVLPDQGKAESVKTLRTTGESQKPQELDAWVKACRHLPTFERHTQVAHHSRIRQIFRFAHRGCGDRLRFSSADR